jgi:hypothetical protein
LFILKVGLAHAFWQVVGENNDEDNYRFCYGLNPCSLYVLVLMLVKLCRNLYLFLFFLAFYFNAHICPNDEKYTSN